MPKPLNARVSRRGVMTLGAGTAGALAVAVASASLAPARQSAREPSEANDQPTESNGRYQVTEHVLRYYRTARV